MLKKMISALCGFNVMLVITVQFWLILTPALASFKDPEWRQEQVKSFKIIPGKSIISFLAEFVSNPIIIGELKAYDKFEPAVFKLLNVFIADVKGLKNPPFKPRRAHRSCHVRDNDLFYISSVKAGKKGPFVYPDISCRNLAVIMKMNCNLPVNEIYNSFLFTVDFNFAVLLVISRKLKVFDKEIGPQLSFGDTIGDGVGLTHLIGSFASVFDSPQRGVEGSFDVPNTHARQQKAKEAQNGGSKSTRRGALLCAQVLLVMCCLIGGFGLFIHTFENSTRFSPDAGALRVLLSCFSVGCGGVLALVFFAGL